MLMAKAPLSTIDLNLLVAFDALISERHVSRAAHKLGRSQSALSHALARLRELFQDELFVRSQQSMQPTPRALELAGPIRAALAGIDAAIHRNQTFNPAQTERTFTLGMSDYTAFLFLPPLMREIRRLAPGINLHVRHANRDEGNRWVLSGEVDLAVGNFAQTSTRLRRHVLYQERFVCVAWQGRPALASPLTLDDYLSLPHLLVSINGDPGGMVDDVLAQQGLARNVVAVVPHYLVVPRVVQHTDLVATVSVRIPHIFASLNELRFARAPLALPLIPITQIYDRRFELDSGHAWLRELMIRISDELETQFSRQSQDDFTCDWVTSID